MTFYLLAKWEAEEFSPASLGLLLMKHHLGDGNVFKAFNS